MSEAIVDENDTTAEAEAAAVKRRVRVLIVVENLPVPYDRRVWREATTLYSAGYSVTVISPSGHRAPAGTSAIEGVYVYRYPMLLEGDSKLRLLFEYGWALLCISALVFWVGIRRGFDVVQVCNPPDIFWPILFVCRMLGKVTVFDHHDLSPEMYQGKFGERDDLFYRLLLRMERLTFRAADFVISTNRSYREVARERGGISDERAAIVRNGPDPERLFRVPVDFSWRKGRSTLVAFLGEIGEQDGVDRLIDAVHRIVHTRGRQDIHYVVMGGGPNHEEIVAQARRLEIDRWITFTGRVDSDIISSVLSTADIAVDPSPRSAYADKSTAAKIMEYMLFGLPIVAFRLTETEESAGETAVYANPTDVVAFADLIVQLADDPARRRAFGLSGHKRVMEGLLWRHSAQIYLDLMERARKLHGDRSSDRLARRFVALAELFRRSS